MSTGSRSLFQPILLALFALLVPAIAARAQAPALVERVWYEGHTAHRVWMATDEMAVVFETNDPRTDAQSRFEQSTPQATLIKQDGPVAYYKLDARQSPGEDVVAARRQTGVRHAGPVFYRNPRDPRSAMALSGEIVVGFRAAVDAQALDQFAKRFGLTLVQALSYAPNTFIFDARSANDSLDLANKIRTLEGVAAAYPNWIRSLGRR